MKPLPHRNIAKGKVCPKCDHFHGVEHSNVPGATGLCIKDPPEPFIIGMAPSTPSVIKNEQLEMVPIIRSSYPPVGPGESCSLWTPRAEGEA